MKTVHIFTYYVIHVGISYLCVIPVRQSKLIFFTIDFVTTSSPTLYNLNKTYQDFIPMESLTTEDYESAVKMLLTGTTLNLL
jgi:hypothetical protein